jgi:hypothetical protein
MSTGNQRRTRSDRVAGLQLPPGNAERLFGKLRRGDVLLRVGLALLAALAMWAATGAWAPRFAFRSGYTPARDIVARTTFSVVDKEATEKLRRRARSQTLAVYYNDKQRLVEMRNALKDAIFQVTNAESFESLSEKDRRVWLDFLAKAKDSEATQVNQEQLFNDLREGLSEDAELSRLETAVQSALDDYERKGLLVSLLHDLGEGSQSAILVHDIGQQNSKLRVEVTDVRIAEAAADLRQRLAREFEAVELPGKHVETLAQLAYNWLINKKLPTTLGLNAEATREEQQKAIGQVEEATKEFHPGETLVTGGNPLTKDDIDQLLIEYRSQIASMTFGETIRRSLADIGMFVALYVLCGTYIYFHHPAILADMYRLATLLGLVVVTVTISMIAAADQWRAETIPLMLFGTTIAVAYRRELALLVGAGVALIIAISTGQGLPEFVILVASLSASILLTGRIRSRTKLIYVGLGAAVVAAFTALGVGTLMEQSYGWSGLTASAFGSTEEVIRDSFALRIVAGSLWYGFCAILAGILMTGLLPFIERLFDVQTDISLLELGDAAHPLLQELVRRAPGTYNHSITVASIAEAAAEGIGANGLLVRVGAYFHDIGKMLKPNYFIENQGSGANRHDSLMPAMSTLVIIAHVKDGADLARQHHLPRSIIDFIEQHHGTTLVEYFYREAAKRSEQDPDSSDVDETSFRYPGPKPQSREAGVLMLADAAESICRTLVDPAPSRIENVLRELMMSRLMDGQFDECSLTLKELHIIEETLVKSLTAVYHGRVKYPSQQTA